MNWSFRPAILHLADSYDRRSFRADVGAGLTVGFIALPLAIGFAIASGCTPAQGLWTAIVGGFLITVLGGSKFQIGGPTGAFVPILAGVVAVHGFAGLALATMLAGLMLILAGLFKLGALLRYIPFPVVAGFTSGIAVIIFLGQIPSLLGLSLAGKQHAPEIFLETVRHLPDIHWPTALTGAVGLLVVLLLPKLTRRVPAAIVAVAITSILVAFLHWPVETIGSKFGELPSTFPGWHLPTFTLPDLRALMGPAFTIAALGAIESLLSATVADGMTDTRHDSNSELIGQGLANFIVPLVGGFAATGAIARTAANIRSGARSPVAGLVHAASLLLFVLVAAPLTKHIPLAGLAAILMGVALRMAEWSTFRETWRGSHADFATLLTTFTLTILFDLTIGVSVGLLIGVVLFVKRMEDISHVSLLTPDDDPEHDGSLSLRGKEVPAGVVLFRFEGPLFFAVVAKLESVLRTYSGRPKIIIFRLRHVPSIDASALHALEIAVSKMQHDGVRILLTAVQPQPMKALTASGLTKKLGPDSFCRSIDDALLLANQILAEEPPDA